MKFGLRSTAILLLLIYVYCNGLDIYSNHLIADNEVNTSYIEAPYKSTSAFAVKFKLPQFYAVKIEFAETILFKPCITFASTDISNNAYEKIHKVLARNIRSPSLISI